MAETRQFTYIEAVNAALARALAEDDNVIVFGEDVGKPGGVFGATKQLQKRFGRRVFDTPISESAILGGAVGAAMMGMRPVAEIMWTDFTLVALDQIVNQASNVRYVSNGQLTAPLTVRTQQGVLTGSCAQHSQSLEAFFAHVPGLRVCMPATAQDAYDLLLAAIHCDDPTIVIESRRLYFGDKQPVEVDGPISGVGGARVLRSGSDVTLVTWGAMVHDALEAADLLDADGVSAEVIDLRWLSPFDSRTVVESVRKTSRLAISHEANVTAGFGAEVAARVGDAAFYSLDAPILRVGTPDVRMPAAQVLQDALVPNAASIATEINKLLNA